MAVPLPEMLPRAREHLEAARRLQEEGLYAPAASRAYYAIVAAMLAGAGRPRERGRFHSRLRAMFVRAMHERGVPGREARRIREGIEAAERDRVSADYYARAVSPTAVEDHIRLAEEVIGMVEEWAREGDDEA